MSEIIRFRLLQLFISIKTPFPVSYLELKKALVTLGRPGVQVAVISRRRQGYFLTHIEGAGGSKKFPLVNGESVGPHAQPLKNHDVIELAGVEMEFFVGE